jgi:ATP-dependent Clp protease ATP-binding subunit ClpB
LFFRRYVRLPELEKAEEEEEEGGNTRLLSDAVTEEQIAKVVAKRTGISLEAMSQTERKRLAELETWLSCEVVGQPEAVAAVAGCVRRSKVSIIVIFFLKLFTFFY